MVIEGASWALFSRKLKDPNSGLGVELQLIRELDAPELGRIRRSSRLLRQFRASWGWMRYLHNRGKLEAALAEARGAAEAASGTFNQSHLDVIAELAHALLLTLSSWVEQIRASVDTGGADVSEGLLTRARAIYDEESPYAKLANSLPSSSWSIEVARVARDGEVASKLILHPAGVEVDDLGQRLHDSMLPLAAADVLVNRNAIEDAARLMYELKAEVLYGLPCLLQPEALLNPSDHQVDVEDLPLDMVESVLNAIRMSEAIDRQSSGVSEQGASLRRDEETSPKPPVEPQDARPGESGKPDGQQQVDPTPDGATRADSPVVPTESPSHVVVDWQAFVHEAIDLADEVEAAWSTALKDGVMANKILMTRISSLLSVTLQEIDKVSKDQQVSGLSSELPHFPLLAEGAAALDLTPNDQIRATQLGLARVYAMKELTDSLAPLQLARGGRAPGKTFWESGAFSRTREMAINAAGLIFGEDAEPDWHSYLHSLRWALAHGFVEAGVLYASLALRAMPVRAYEAMAGGDKSHYDAVIRTLEIVFQRYAAGGKVSVDVTWPLASFCRDSLARFQYLQLASGRRPTK